MYNKANLHRNYQSRSYLTEEEVRNRIRWYDEVCLSLSSMDMNLEHQVRQVEEKELSLINSILEEQIAHPTYEAEFVAWLIRKQYLLNI